MRVGDKPGTDSSEKTAGSVARQLATAMELPFVLIGSVLAGGLIGYGVDSWLHIRPFGMLAGGALGFAAGIRELLRRLSKDGG